MNREQACNYLRSSGFSEEQIKAIEGAFTCENCISRQEAIDAIYARYIGGKEAVDKAPANDQYAEGIDEAVCAVEDLPPVNPKPKSECEHDHEILKAYSDGASAVLDNVRAEIEQMNNLDYVEPVTVHEILQIIDKYTAESEDKG